MKILSSHPWEVTPKVAKEIQNKLRRKFVKKKIDLRAVRNIAGVDAAYSKLENRLYAAATLFSYPNLTKKEACTAAMPINFPYIPGLLTFREGPAILEALGQLNEEPDVIMFDGQGYAHPRHLGIATHIGILINKPTIGVAKSPLTGEFKTPRTKRGNQSKLIESNKQIGIVLRTKDNVAPLFISVGYQLNLPQSVELVLSCCIGYRLPEPIRQAHLLANRMRKMK